MRKLILESLQVESFETTAAAPQPRGTVQGHAAIPDTGGTTVIEPGTRVSVCIICEPWTGDWRCVPQTYDVRNCGETKYFDCTFGCTQRCSYNTGCVDICWVDADTQRCAVE